MFSYFWASNRHLEKLSKIEKIDDLIHFSNVLLGKVLILKNIFQVTMNKWFKNKWNVVQYKVISVILINGKKRFRFYIFCCLKIWQKFEKKVCLLRGRRGGNISWQTQLRSSNVIYQQTLNRLYQPRWNTNQNKWKNACPLYIILQGLKLQRLKIIYKIQPPSLFISYLLSYILMGSLKVIVWFRVPRWTSIITTLCIFRIGLPYNIF